MSRFNGLAKFSISESRRILDAVAPTHGRHLHDEYADVDHSIPDTLKCLDHASTLGRRGLEVMCTVHLCFTDPSDCGLDLQRVARHLLLRFHYDEVCVRVFQLRVPLPAHACSDPQDAACLASAVRERLCGIDSELVAALRDPCFAYGVEPCILLPEGFDELHASMKHQWLNDVIQAVEVHQIMPQASSVVQVRRWNALRVTWSLNDAVWRIRPRSYDEYLWANIQRLQNQDSRFVTNTTLRMQTTGSSSLLRPTLDPLARLLTWVEQSVFKALLSPSMGLQVFASVWASQEHAPQYVADLFGLTYNDLRESSGAAGDDVIMTRCWRLSKSTPSETAAETREWMLALELELYKRAIQYTSDCVSQHMYSTTGFELGAWSNAKPTVLQDVLKHRVRMMLEMWCRVSRALGRAMHTSNDNEHTHSASVVWANRLLQMESGFDTVMCELKPQRIEACWRDTMCVVFRNQLPNGARNWLTLGDNDDNDEDDTKQHWTELKLDEETHKIIELLSERFVAMAEANRFHPRLTSHAIVAECSQLAPMLDVDVLLYRNTLRFMSKSDVLCRIVASVVLWAQQPMSAPTSMDVIQPREVLYALFRARWQYGNFTAAKSTADHVTRRCIASFVNHTARFIMRDVLNRAHQQEQRVRQRIQDANTSQLLNALESLSPPEGTSSNLDAHSWKHWAKEHAMLEPKWLFAHANVEPLSSEELIDTPGLALYRCAICLCLCHTDMRADTSHDDRDQYELFYCGGRRCMWYGTLQHGAQQLVRARFTPLGAQRMMLLETKASIPMSLTPTWSLEAYTQLAWLYDTNAQHGYAGFFNPWVTGSSDLLAPGVLLGREPVDDHAWLRDQERRRRQALGVHTGLLADAGTRRSDEEHVAQFAALGVRPPVVRATGPSRLRDHKWWLRIHALPQADLITNHTHTKAVSLKPQHVQVHQHHESVAFSSGGVPDDTESDAKHQGVLAPGIAKDVARAYVSHLGMPWLTQHGLVKAESHQVSLDPEPNHPFTHRCVVRSQDPECVYWPCLQPLEPVTPTRVELEDSKSCVYKDEDEDTTVRSLQVMGAEEASVLDSEDTLSASSSTSISTDEEDQAQQVPPSVVSTAATNEDWGDSDLYEEQEETPVTIPTHAKLKLQSVAPESESVHSQTKAANPTPLVVNTNTHTRMELFPNSTDIDFRARQLSHRFATGFLC